MLIGIIQEIIKNNTVDSICNRFRNSTNEIIIFSTP